MFRKKWCGGWYLNPRTPTGQGPEPCAFDLSWQPPRERKKECAFDKCLSCLGAGSRPGRPVLLSTLPVAGLSPNQLSGRNTVFSEEVLLKNISMLFSTP